LKSGKINGTPSIIVDDDDIAHTHYFPQAFAYAGADGKYYYKLAVITIDGQRATLENFCAGENIDHFAERATWANFATSGTGEKYSIGKDYDTASDTFNLKKLVQLASGKPIVKPYQGGETDANMDHVPIRSISERATGAQVTVTAATSDNTILVAGNSYGAAGAPISVTNSRVTMSVIDGLVTSLAAGSGGAGWWGTINWRFYTNISDTTPYEHLQIKYEDGIVTEVKYQGPGGTLTTITGTEASPGTANFASFATP